MEILVATMLAWLSLNFSLPAVEQPRVAFVAPQDMVARRLQLAEEARPAVAREHGHGEGQAAGVHAFYDDKARTIYLPEGWTGRSPAEASMLLHELVHHVQNVQREKFACAAEREKLAYRAQSRWLEEAGTSLGAEFQVDPMTLLVRTNCMH